MKLFVDTANIVDIEAALASGVIRGITTNPSLLAKEPKANYIEHLERVVGLARRDGRGASVSVEVFTDDQTAMVRQARELWEVLAYEHLAIKIHVSRSGQQNLSVVRALTREGIAVNCTACMTALQASMAAAAGARYVSLFYNRIRDGASGEGFAEARKQFLVDGRLEPSDFSPNEVIRATRQFITDYPQAEIIVGSIRSVVDVKHAALAGAHIVTASWKVLSAALQHFKTDEAVDQFFRDFAAWTQ